MPRMNARSMAEMIAVPGYAQLSMLTAQKYPKKGGAKFMVPYYGPAIAGFRQAISSNDPANALSAAESKAQAVGNKSRRENLARALDRFKHSGLLDRPLKLRTNAKIEASVGTVELRASPDLVADDGKGPIVMYFNCNILAYDQETARRLLEIAHWLYGQNNIDIAPQRFEMLDLASGTLHQGKKPRSTTIAQMKKTATVIESVWDAI